MGVLCGGFPTNLSLPLINCPWEMVHGYNLGESPLRRDVGTGWKVFTCSSGSGAHPMGCRQTRRPHPPAQLGYEAGQKAAQECVGPAGEVGTRSFRAWNPVILVSQDCALGKSPHLISLSQQPYLGCWDVAVPLFSG